MSILFKGNLEEGNYTLIKSTDGWVLKGKTSYVGFNFVDRPSGEWIGERVGHGPGYTCSLCDYGVQPWNNTNFCPNCGAKMKGENDE